MPLVDLVLSSPTDRTDRARRGHTQAERQLQCAAGFYPMGDSARAVARALCDTYGLSAHQVTVLDPLRPPAGGWTAAARRWQRQRRDDLEGVAVAAPIAGVALGLLTGSVAAATTTIAPMAVEPSLAVSAWLSPLLFTAAGLLAGWAVAWRLGRRRFDMAVRQQLRAGSSAVVVQGLRPDQQGPVLAFLQGSSHRWCAEAPRSTTRG